MTHRQLAAGLRRMRKLNAEGRLKEAADQAAILAPFVHTVMAPIVVSNEPEIRVVPATIWVRTG